MTSRRFRAEGVSFGYRRGQPVLDSLTVAFPAGVSVLLGPNGAGKSTLLRLAASAAFPQAGELRYRGLTLARRSGLREWRQTVGWVPQHVAAMPGMTARDQVAYAGWLKGLSRANALKQADHALEHVALTRKAKELATSLSGGQLRRLGIASALVHDCRLVVMDEPTAGLDPAQRARLHQLIDDMPDVDWLISTHQTEDLPAFADHVAVMVAGEIIWSGEPTDFLALGRGEGRAERAVDAYANLVGDIE